MTQPDAESVPLTLQTPPPGLPQLFKRFSEMRGIPVLVDQAVVSLGNFITLTLLARHLSTEDYGAYGVLTDSLLFFNTLQAALIIYPLTIQGATADKRDVSRLASASLVITLTLLPVLGVSMAISALMAGRPWLAPIGVIAMLLWQMQETLRRALMAELRFAATIWGDFISYPIQALSMFVLYKLDYLNLTSAFVTIALTSLAAAILQTFQIGLVRVTLPDVMEVIRRFWKLGRWMLLGNSTLAITSLTPMWALRFTYGLEANAAFTAVAGVFKLANPIQSSIANLVMPTVANTNKNAGFKAARRVALKYGLMGAAPLAVYFLILLIVPHLALRVFYGHKYGELTGLLRLFTANYCIIYLGTWLAAWINGLGESRTTFVAQSINTVFTLLVGLPLTIKFGVAGLIWGGLIGGILCIGSYLFLMARLPHLKPLSAQATSDKQ